jgi:hypothetical protein
VSGRQNHRATRYGRVPRATELPAHYAAPKSEGDGAVQAWIDLLPDRQAAQAAGENPHFIHRSNSDYMDALLFDWSIGRWLF